MEREKLPGHMADNKLELVVEVDVNKGTLIKSVNTVRSAWAGGGAAARCPTVSRHDSPWQRVRQPVIPCDEGPWRSEWIIGR